MLVVGFRFFEAIDNRRNIFAVDDFKFLRKSVKKNAQNADFEYVVAGFRAAPTVYSNLPKYLSGCIFASRKYLYYENS